MANVFKFNENEAASNTENYKKRDKEKKPVDNR